MLKILNDQLHLLGIQLLGTLAEPVPLKALDQHVQLVDLGAQSGILKLGIGDQLAQRVGILGQVFKAASINLVGQPAYPASSGRRLRAGARHSQPSKSVAS